jgi:uncharacterized protein
MVLTKDFCTKIDDVDSQKGVIVAYANAYGNEDYAKDISAKGSFIKTATEQFKKLRVYKNHNTSQPIGVPLEIDAKDDYGLKTKTRLFIDGENSTQLAKDMFVYIKSTVENGQDADLSIGYEVMKRDEKDRRVIKEYKLYEYSFLTNWGANELATVQGIKSKNDIMQYLVSQYNLPYSDERIKNIEAALKALDNQDEPLKDTPEIIKPYTFASFASFK